MSIGYIYVWTEEILHCSVVRGRRTKKIDGRKNGLKFYLFIITSKYARALQRKKKELLNIYAKR